jgi:hypothetical protein
MKQNAITLSTLERSVRVSVNIMPHQPRTEASPGFGLTLLPTDHWNKRPHSGHSLFGNSRKRITEKPPRSRGAGVRANQNPRFNGSHDRVHSFLKLLEQEVSVLQNSHWARHYKELNYVSTQLNKELEAQLKGWSCANRKEK